MSAKLHELLAVEDTVIGAAEKLLAETNEKFNKHTEFFTGHVRTLERLRESPEDKAIEVSQRLTKVLPTNVLDTLDYIVPFVDRALTLKLQKHRANQSAQADVVIDGKVVISAAPVDFLLDLEKAIPRWRAIFGTMPTLDPSKDWVVERKGVWKTKEATVSAQTEKRLFPVELSPATEKHPAQVRESSRDEVVGKFSLTTMSGAATSQQKADALKWCDQLLSAVKQARMRANSVEVKPETSSVFNTFRSIFEPQA